MSSTMERIIDKFDRHVEYFDAIITDQFSKIGINKVNYMLLGGLTALTIVSSTIYLQLKYPNEGDMSLVRSDRELLHNKYHTNKVPNDIDVIIIGSGMGGLSCAAILARLGRKVLVLEQHDDVLGGGTHMFTEKGYRFDSGLHYTVPWSVPVFALTCLKKPKDCVPFDLMGEPDGSQDKIYLITPESSKDKINNVTSFNMKYQETHISQLYRDFPSERNAIDQFLVLSDRAMTYVKGARPDKATFMLTASVFRGISKEGGCYPRGGSDMMAKELVTTIESYGGTVLIRAQVDKILVKGGRTVGVRMVGGQEILCNRAVVSAASYLATTKLLDQEICSKYKIPTSFPGVNQSAGFVMCNIGIKASASSIDVTNTNTWHIPITSDGDCFEPISQFFSQPLSHGTDIPTFITFPSMKDKEYSAKYPNKTSVQMLIMADYQWFEEFLGQKKESNVVTKEGKPTRADGYEEYKSVWLQRCKEIFLKYYPKAEPFIEYIDISTPLSIEQWLAAPRGGAVGLDVTPQRFVDPTIRNALDPVTSIPGLYLTGQDTSICGVTLCQIAGITTAFRMEGLWAAIKTIGQSVLLGN